MTPGGNPSTGRTKRSKLLGALAAAGANYTAQIPGGAAINTVGPFIQYGPPRTVRITLGAGGVATVFTVTGRDPNGNVLTEVINHPGGAGSADGAIAFVSLNSVVSDVDPVGTTDIECGPGFGLCESCASIDAIFVDGTIDAPVSSNAQSGSVVPGIVPNGARVFFVEYSS